MSEVTVLIIGCGTIGTATAHLVLADAKFQHLVVADRDFKRAEILAEQLSGSVSALQLDSLEEEQVARALN